MNDTCLVIAPSYHRYRFYCDDKGLDRKNHRFVSSLHQMRGLRVPPERIHFTEDHTVETIIDAGGSPDATETDKLWAGALISVTEPYRD